MRYYKFKINPLICCYDDGNDGSGVAPGDICFAWIGYVGNQRFVYFVRTECGGSAGLGEFGSDLAYFRILRGDK